MSAESTAFGAERPRSGEAAEQALLQRRALIAGGSAAGLGIAALVLPSASAAASVDGLLVPDGTFTTPTGFDGTAGDTTVTLQWDQVTGADGYQVQYRAGSSDPFALFVDVPGEASTGVTVSGLTNGTSYDFRVVAYQGAAVSSPTSIITRTPALTAPGVPVDIAASPSESQQVAVTWFQPATGGAVALYRVEYRVSPSGSWQAGGTTAERSLTISGLTNDTAYDVQVRAENAAGDSDYSSAVTVTPLASTAETVTAPEPQPPVVGIVTHPTSIVVVTDRLEPANAGFTYSWKVRNADDSTYQTITFATGDATFTLTGVPTSGEYTVRKTDGTTTNLSSFSYVRRQRSHSPGALYQLNNPTSGSTYVGTVQVYVRGGAGGSGGLDDGFLQTTRSGGAPSKPGEVEAVVPFAIGEQLRFAVGSGGGNGRDNWTDGGGGVGGTNVLTAYNGGRGGNAGPSGDSGAGGGGGAASVVLRGTSLATSSPVVIAGGAAGGGGGNVSTDRNGAPGLTTPGGHTGTTGQQGAERGDDSAGGGGGGGGAVAGLGGQLETYGGKGRTTLSTAARPGTNLVASGVTASVDGLVLNAAPTASGWIQVTYLEPSTIVNTA